MADEKMLKFLEMKNKITSCGTRTRKTRIRRPMPYPLGHGGMRTIN